MKFFVLLALVLFGFHEAYALSESRPTLVDSRLRVIVYNPEDVFKFTGFYNYQASIEFEDSETIESVSMGDSVAWQMVPSGKRLFLKPIDDNATTNMTLITNKRTYYFELHAKEASGINDPELVFSVKFIYPDTNFGSSSKALSTAVAPDLTRPDLYNFDYSIAGEADIAPIKVFDDGEFTYFEFKGKNAEVPAIFAVGSDSKEALVNYRVTGKYVVVEKVASKFTLRNGDEIICVFNEKTSPKRIAKPIKSGAGSKTSKGGSVPISKVTVKPLPQGRQ